MSTYSDEPVLVKPTARGTWKRWLAIVLALGVTGVVIYLPFEKDRLAHLAHDVARGPNQGARYPLTLDGKPHTLELTWAPDGQFAPVLDPAPAPGTTLRLKSRAGAETLAWNTDAGCFGPTTFGGINPYAHYKLSLRLERAGLPLWSDTLYAYGVHDTEGHSH